MALVCRFFVFAVTITALIGCETIPQHQILDTYPASGPTGIRAGLSYASNVGMDSDRYSGKYDSIDDTSDCWGNTYGFNFEIPVDYNPYFGGFLGLGYEVKESRKPGPFNVDDMKLLPMYVGVMARYPFWLDKEKWDKAIDPIWLPNKPVGPAIYTKVLAGGSALLNIPKIRQGNDVHRALDMQIFPFVEGDVGVEYRFGRMGTWCEFGYRQYAIINSGLEGFNPSEMGDFRTMIGVSFYLW